MAIFHNEATQSIHNNVRIIINGGKFIEIILIKIKNLYHFLFEDSHIVNTHTQKNETLSATLSAFKVIEIMTNYFSLSNLNSFNSFVCMLI